MTSRGLLFSSGPMFSLCFARAIDLEWNGMPRAEDWTDLSHTTRERENYHRGDLGTERKQSVKREIRKLKEPF